MVPPSRRQIIVRLLLLVLLPPTLGFNLFKRNAPEPEEDDRDTITRAQIYLDSQWFGPGKIDGRMGTFTRQAAEDYNLRHGHDATNWYYIIKAAEKSVKDPYRTFTIPEFASRYVGSLPASRSAQAQKDYMPYRSYHEFVAERFHASMNFIKVLNPDINVYNLRPGSTVTVPAANEFQIEKIESDVQFEEDPALSARTLMVDTKRKTVRFFDGDQLLASFPITPGREKFIPYGKWKCVNMVTTPEFRYDSQMLNAGKRSENFHMLPPGPNSPVGIFWAGLDKSGIGFHGTNNPETIGRAQSAGCIRLANWDAVRLSQLFRPGAAVEVR